MRLAVDFGNSRIKIGIFPEDAFQPSQVLTLDYSQTFEGSNLIDFAGSACIYAAVRKDVEKVNWLEKNFKCKGLSYQSKLPFKLDYQTPETLGVDRIAACAGASLYVDAPYLVIDSGTCITLDLIDKDMFFKGGVISPGISMRLRSMHEFTDALPLIDLEKRFFKQPPLGNDTKSCMISSAINGTTYELKGFIEELGQGLALNTVVTGAWSEDLANKMENTTFVAPNLVLPGLIKILELNEL